MNASQDTILVVEDSRMLSRVLAKMIEDRLNARVLIAHTLTQAKALLDAHTGITTAILDLTLPDAPDGEIIDIVLALGIPSVVLTSHYDEKLRAEILRKGVVDYVTKDNRFSYDYVVRLLRRLSANRHIKALLVDDSSTDRTFIRNLLRLQCFQIHEACHGRQALEIVARYPDIRLVITDFHMPVLDGFEFVSELRTRHGHEQMVIIGLSSQSDGSVSARFIKRGANDFLAKPFSHEEFFVRVMQNLDAQEHLIQISHAARCDYLTNLYNRRYFMEQGQSSLASTLRKKEPCCVAMLDIDHFKRINDCHGHDTGDQVIRHLAKQLTTLPAIAARLGGEEFGLLIPSLDIAASRQLLDTLRLEIASAATSEGVHYTVSIGLTMATTDHLEDTLKCADKALYAAKQQGRNRVAIKLHAEPS